MYRRPFATARPVTRSPEVVRDSRFVGAGERVVDLNTVVVGPLLVAPIRVLVGDVNAIAENGDGARAGERLRRDVRARREAPEGKERSQRLRIERYHTAEARSGEDNIIAQREARGP